MRLDHALQLFNQIAATFDLLFLELLGLVLADSLIVFDFLLVGLVRSFKTTVLVFELVYCAHVDSSDFVLKPVDADVLIFDLV